MPILTQIVSVNRRYTGIENPGQFKKGQSGNPKGRKPLPEDLKLLLRETGEKMKRDICEVCYMTVRELQEIDGNAEKGEISVFKATLISSLNNGLQTGDDKALKLVLDRILGKVPEQLPDDPGEDKSNQAKDAVLSELAQLIIKEKK